MPPPRSTGMPLPRRRNWRPDCVPSGIVTLARPPSQRRHFDGAAERRRHERHRRAAIKIVSVALEHRMRLDRDEDVEIARRPAIQARLAFARQADARAFLDARRNVDAERAFLLHMARCLCRACRDCLMILPVPRQPGQVRSMVKKPCCARTLPMPEQVGHCSALWPGFGAAAAAGFAGDRARHLDLRRCGP